MCLIMSRPALCSHEPCPMAVGGQMRMEYKFNRNIYRLWPVDILSPSLLGKGCHELTKNDMRKRCYYFLPTALPWFLHFSPWQHSRAFHLLMSKPGSRGWKPILVEKHFISKRFCHLKTFQITCILSRFFPNLLSTAALSTGHSALRTPTKDQTGVLFVSVA